MKSMSQTGGIAAGCGFRRHVCVSLFLFRHQSGLTQYTGVLFFLHTAWFTNACRQLCEKFVKKIQLKLRNDVPYAC